MEELRKQSITHLSECSDYQLSKLYEIPKFLEWVEEHAERSQWVSVAETKEAIKKVKLQEEKLCKTHFQNPIPKPKTAEELFNQMIINYEME